MCNREEEYKEANDDVPELVQAKKRLKLSLCESREEQELLHWKIKNLLVIKEGCDDAPDFQRWINDQLKKLVHAHIMPAGQETATIKNLLVIKEGCDDAPDLQQLINDQLKKLVYTHVMPAGQETTTEHNNNNIRQNNTTEHSKPVATGLLLKCQYDTDIED